ncbi:hypothetical protein ACJX0J_036156 [Zea mays]
MYVPLHLNMCFVSVLYDVQYELNIICDCDFEWICDYLHVFERNACWFCVELTLSQVADLCLVQEGTEDVNGFQLGWNRTLIVYYARLTNSHGVILLTEPTKPLNNLVQDTILCMACPLVGPRL